MLTPKRSAAVLLALLLFGTWFAWLRPTALGGPASFIMVSGESMEPVYENGDLVILQKAPEYDEGDIIAFPMDNSPRLVIHRIVGADERGFITQGDNRDREDPWRPTPERIQGKALLHIPNVGGYLHWMRSQPWRLAWVVAGLVLVGSVGGVQAERGRRRTMNLKRKTQPGGQGAPPTGPTSFWTLATGLGIAGVAALICAAVAVFAFRISTETANDVELPAYDESGTMTYAITMTPSTVFPDGVLRSPSPLAEPAAGGNGGATPAFASLVQDAGFNFVYELEAENLAEVTGTIAVDLVIRPDDLSWTRTFPVVAAVPFEGTTISRPFVVDLAGVSETIRQIESETGFRSGAYQVIITPRVDVTGTRNGEPFASTFEAPFPLAYTDALVTPPVDLVTRIPTTTPSVVMSPRSVSLAGFSLDISALRALALGGLVVSLGVLLVLGGMLGWDLWSDEHTRIRARYGARLMDVETSSSQRGRAAIRIASMHDLARLAERYESFILHETTSSGHRYFVRDGSDTYEYAVHSRDDGRYSSTDAIEVHGGGK